MKKEISWKTYMIGTGTIGYDKEEKMEFPTEEEAIEYFREKEKEDQN